MRDGITARHYRDKQFVMDLHLDNIPPMASPREIERVLSERRDIYDSRNGRRIAKMSVAEFLEKFG